MKCSLVISNFLKELSSLSYSIVFYSIEGEKMETVTYFILGGSKITVDDSCSHGIKRHFLIGRKGMTNLECIKKQRDHFVDKGSYSQSYVFSWWLRQ